MDTDFATDERLCPLPALPVPCVSTHTRMRVLAALLEGTLALPRAAVETYDDLLDVLTPETWPYRHAMERATQCKYVATRANAADTADTADTGTAIATFLAVAAVLRAGIQCVYAVPRSRELADVYCAVAMRLHALAAWHGLQVHTTQISPLAVCLSIDIGGGMASTVYLLARDVDIALLPLRPSVVVVEDPRVSPAIMGLSPYAPRCKDAAIVYIGLLSKDCFRNAVTKNGTRARGTLRVYYK